MSLIEKINQAKQAVGQVIVGQEEVVELLFVALLGKGHVMLESVPGSGKTKLAKSFAKIINGDFSRVQFTPDVLPSDVTGIQFLNPKTNEFEMRVGPIKTNILLADEINRATPRTQSSLLEVMEEQQTTIDGITIAIPSPFLVIATQNPIESNHGTFPLPEAQLDRFLMIVTMDYPTLEQEKAILNLNRTEDPLQLVNPILTTNEIETLQKEVTQVDVSDVVQDYLLALVRETRDHADIELGVSSRAALALMRAGQALAYLRERSYVTPQDIKALVCYVFEHRIVLSMEGSIRKTKSEVIDEVIRAIDVPVELGTRG
ncbi:magnesium chelatase [Virgibacillus phasianinus]|uniref:Magnesium chelatase n=1 Tax=Virgibacillus phasianinus TaxID=2017483 RepID=A0A220TZ21_9BACI|nr:MoxR family ATPase [Virgibacillus phasianinus]ASK61128.1 magnesium chelatase [Virgibacillus phasianinus]